MDYCCSCIFASCTSDIIRRMPSSGLIFHITRRMPSSEHNFNFLWCPCIMIRAQCSIPVESADRCGGCAGLAGNYQSKVLFEKSGKPGETTVLQNRMHPNQQKFFDLLGTHCPLPSPVFPPFIRPSFSPFHSTRIFFPGLQAACSTSRRTTRNTASSPMIMRPSPYTSPRRRTDFSTSSFCTFWKIFTHARASAPSSSPVPILPLSSTLSSVFTPSFMQLKRPQRCHPPGPSRGSSLPTSPAFFPSLRTSRPTTAGLPAFAMTSTQQP